MRPLSVRTAAAQRGITMVEILVALTISMLILTGVMHSMLTSQRNTLWSDDVAFIQENARYALELMARDIRRAGYWGCALNSSTAPTTYANALNGGGGGWLKMEGIQGFDGTDQASFPAGLVGGVALWDNPVQDYPPDAVIFRGGDSDLDLGVVSHNKNSAEFKLTRNNPLDVGDIAVVISEDCQDVGLMQMTGPAAGGENIQFVHGTGSAVTPGNCTKAIRWHESFDCSDDYPSPGGEEYGPGSTLMRFFASGYFIGVSSADPSQPALYRSQYAESDMFGTVTQRIDEIAMGVEDMQILYGFDSDEDAMANAYVSADQIDTDAGEWKQVVSVRLALLLRGYGENRQDTGGVEFVGYPFTGGADSSYAGASYDDAILRQQVTRTVRLRNVGAG